VTGSASSSAVIAAPPKPLPVPQAITFDLGDTLIRADPSWTGIYHSVCEEFGLGIDHDDLDRALAEGARSQFWDEVGPFEASEEASFRRVMEFDRGIMAALGHGDVPEAFYRRLGQVFLRRQAWHLFPDVLPALEALRAHGLRTAVISNWVWGGVELLHDLEVAAHFDALVISARIGYQKPHATIFRHALELLGVPPERVIHVGDSHGADVVGARAVGMEAVLIERGHVTPFRPRPAGEPDVAVIRDLGGLLELLAIPSASGTERGLSSTAS
jgi:putative hydrolase of the HAD superfamily